MPVLMPPALPPSDQARFTELVRNASGIEVPAVRRAELDQAVAQSLASTGAADTDALYQLLAEERGRPALEALVESLTIGETHFFRNRPQFDALAGRILPALIERRRATRQLRIWSAGCASGEEAYSLAILVEALLPDLDQWRVLILATDINRQALAKAQRGVYSPWSFREVPPDVQGNFFAQRGRDFEIVPRLRERVTFAYLNLVEAGYPSLLNSTHTMDLILFRNVLIYFREATARQVVGRLHSVLAEGGWLVVGHADPSPGIFEQFAVHNFPGTVIYQKKMGLAPAPEPHVDAPRPAWATAPESPAASEPAATSRPAANNKPAALPALRDSFLEALDAWRRGRPDEALGLLAALAAAEPRLARAPYQAAKFQADRQQLAEAEALVEEALRREPLHAPAHYLHGLILQETNRPQPALAALRRCVYADSQFVLGHFALANLSAQQGQPDRARKAMDNVAQWLTGRARDELVAEGDGLTAGRLMELIAAQKELAAA
jgi:chemotaxis protein methyltransferase CheR